MGKTLAVFAFCTESCVLILLREREINLSQVIKVHICISCILCAFLLYSIWKKHNTRDAFLLFIFFSATGLFGAGITLLTIVLHHMYTKTAVTFSEWFSSLFPEDTNIDIGIYERIQYGWEDFSKKHHVVPFLDVMRLGTEDQKRLAIAKISGHFKPEFAPALLSAIVDKSNPIRVQAATALAKLEHDFSKGIMSVEHKLQRCKKNEASDLLLNLAKMCDTYAHCAIIDIDREQEIRAKAIKYYEDYRKLNKEDITISFALGRLYLLNNTPEKAHILLERCVQGKTFLPARVLKWYMESLFELGRFAELRKFSRENYARINAKDSESLELFEYMKLWAMG